MHWRPGGAEERVATPGAEWFAFRDGLIVEIRDRRGSGAIDDWGD
jgi:hypothetical protein